MQSIRRFLGDEKGLETVEYAVITGLIVVGLLVVIASIGAKVLAHFNALDAGL